MKAKHKNSRKMKAALIPSPELSAAELSKHVYDELRYIIDMMFGPTEKLMLKRDASPYNEEEKKRGIEAAVEFTSAATTVLTDILARKLAGEISEARGRELINSFISACVASEESQRVTRDTFERMNDEMAKLKKKMATKPAREKRAEESNSANAIIMHHAQQWWEKKPKMRKNALGTAKGIKERVNVALTTSKLKPLEEEAIRKRIHKK